MTRRVCLLGPTDSRSTLRTLVRQMSLLWKFDLHEIDCSGAPVTVPDGSPILVELAAGDEAYQETIAGLVQYSTRCILFATSAVSLGPRLGAVSGVRRVEWRPYTADAGVRCLAEDPLLHGICDTVRLLHFKGSAAGHIECDGATVLLEAETRENLLTRKGDCYTIAIPVSQFGIVSFPAFFRLLENALFFADELPHISPGPYVSFRIDDLPVTGESILKRGYADWMGSAEIRAIQSVARDYGARIEYMLSSHTVTASGVLRSAAETAPRAFRMIGRLFRDGEINLGVHGRAHLDLEVYGRERAIEPREFQFMDAERTRITLEGLAEWMRAEFGKVRTGFVAPAWGYSAGVTKSVARGIFRYIADSNQHLQEGEGEGLFGTVRDGCVDLFETWRSGMAGISMADRFLFAAYLDAGLPVHVMLHGALMRDPLTRRRKWAAVTIGGLSLAIAGMVIVAALGPRWATTVLLSGLGVVGIAYGMRRGCGWYLRMALARLSGRGTIHDLAREAGSAGAAWLFLEELADHMLDFASISIVSVQYAGGALCVRISCVQTVRKPLSIHFAFPVHRVIARPKVPIVKASPNALRVGPLAPGAYEFQVYAGPSD